MDIIGLGNSIDSLRKAFPTVFSAFDDIVFLTLGQWTELLSEKQRIKHKKSLEDFQNKIYENVSVIPKDDIVEPDLSILGPTLEASKFFIENELLRDMFAKAAASSIDNRLANYSRSSFVEFIKQLSPIDIKLLRALKGNIEFGTIGNNETIKIEGAGVLPIIDIMIESSDNQTFFKENIVPKSLSDELNCSYDELSSSVDNMIRLGIITKKNNELTRWRMKDTRNWFKDNKAISDAYNSINSEVEEIMNNIYERDNPKHEVKYENGKKYITDSYTSFTEDLDKNLKLAKSKNVVILHDRLIKLTSLGNDFIKVCM